MMPTRYSFFLFVAVTTTASACHKSSEQKTEIKTKGTRHLGIHITPAENQDYNSAYARARQAGIDCVPFTMQWTELEQDGIFDPESLLDNVNGFYGGSPTAISLCISPTAANRKDVPDDLSGVSFDDPEMISRFNRLLDTIHAHLTSINMRYLLIGNEVDIYLEQYPGEWRTYIKFCKAVRLHAKLLWGDQLIVGAETSMGSFSSPNNEQIDSLHAAMDVVSLTYYPLNNDFTMQAVSQVRTDIEKMLSRHPNQQVLFQEVGYATSAVCKGSENAQADFVKEVFRVWDDHADQMIFVAFLWLNDLSDEQTKAVVSFYGLGGNAVEQTFTAYIASLGLCDQQGVAKPGFLALQQEAVLRGWK